MMRRCPLVSPELKPPLFGWGDGWGFSPDKDVFCHENPRQREEVIYAFSRAKRRHQMEHVESTWLLLGVA